MGVQQTRRVPESSQIKGVRGEAGSVRSQRTRTVTFWVAFGVLHGDNTNPGRTVAPTQASTTTPAQGAKRFDHLIESTCHLVGLPSEKVWIEKESSDYRLASFANGEVDCALSFRFHAPDTLFIHCQFGPLPAEPRGSKAMLSLLQLNLMLYEDRSPTFAADLEGNVMLCMAVPLESMQEAPMLAGVMENLSIQASSWREVWLADA